jgi:hypothetical protein
MASRYFPKTVPLSLPAQIARMRDLYPALCRVSWERGLLQWEGSLQPMDASHEYRIKITYRLRRAPRVRVLTPELKVNSKGEAIPHRYRDGNLCLYIPDMENGTPRWQLLRPLFRGLHFGSIITRSGMPSVIGSVGE